VAKENNHDLITLVQKAKRISERAKKRVAKEQARENRARKKRESGNQVKGRAPKRAKVAMRAPRHSGRHG
jgi:rhamnose utilization protein RhaD (predicted bifunctional aldolase and dehydrogenase)